MARIKDLNSALPGENDAFAFDGANGTKRISYAEFKQKLIDDGFGSGSSEAVVLTQAEYNALPDEVKDSDTIFFISDAPFDLPNVVTCTAAEYAAMSDATKLDGRLYYVTDEAEVAKSLVVQTNQNSTETVPSSAVVYSGLKGINDKLALYATVSTTSSDTIKTAIASALSTILNTSLSVNRSYPVMIVLTGSIIGTYTGTINKTSTAVRFLIGYNRYIYTGTYYNGEVTEMYSASTTAVS